MAKRLDSKGFDSSRAELFESLIHPVRIRIMESLKDSPLGFAELKRKAGLDSSGNFQFHLNKLKGLVGAAPEGYYVLTADGKEALRIVETVNRSRLVKKREWELHPPLTYDSIWAFKETSQN